jgi:hypothetical protein
MARATDHSEEALSCDVPYQRSGQEASARELCARPTKNALKPW